MRVETKKEEHCIKEKEKKEESGHPIQRSQTVHVTLFVATSTSKNPKAKTPFPVLQPPRRTLALLRRSPPFWFLVLSPPPT